MSEISPKEKLLTESQEKFDSLLQLIDSVSPRKRSLSVDTSERDKNFRDVMMHLYEWHAMLERWYREGMSGDIPSMPAPGFKWNNLKKLNERIWESCQDFTLNQSIKKVTLSHERVRKLIESHTDEEIITKKYYNWTKTTNLYAYFAANTTKHYDWAIKQCDDIAKFITEQKEV